MSEHRQHLQRTALVATSPTRSDAHQPEREKERGQTTPSAAAAAGFRTDAAKRQRPFNRRRIFVQIIDGFIMSSDPGFSLRIVFMKSQIIFHNRLTKSRTSPSMKDIRNPRFSSVSVFFPKHFLNNGLWTIPRGRPRASWLRQVESYLRDSGMAGLASAWVMARGWPWEYHRKVDSATHCFGVCSHP